MTLEEAQILTGKRLNRNTFSIKSLYGDVLYFYKRELQADHYFFIEKQNKLYKLLHNPNNYDDSVTETANSADSFKLPFVKLLQDGGIEEFERDIGENAKKDTQSIINEIDSIIIRLTELKIKLK